MKFSSFHNFLLTILLSVGITSGSYVFAPNLPFFSLSAQFSKTLESDDYRKFDIISIFDLIQESGNAKDHNTRLHLGFIPSSSYNIIRKTYQTVSVAKLHNRFSTISKHKLNILHCTFLI